MTKNLSDYLCCYDMTVRGFQPRLADDSRERFDGWAGSGYETLAGVARRWASIGADRELTDAEKVQQRQALHAEAVRAFASWRTHRPAELARAHDEARRRVLGRSLSEVQPASTPLEHARHEEIRQQLRALPSALARQSAVLQAVDGGQADIVAAVRFDPQGGSIVTGDFLDDTIARAEASALRHAEMARTSDYRDTTMHLMAAQMLVEYVDGAIAALEEPEPAGAVA